jgi:hypothetical protein
MIRYATRYMHTFIKIGLARLGVSRYRNQGGRRNEEEEDEAGVSNFETGKENLRFHDVDLRVQLQVSGQSFKRHHESASRETGQLDHSGGSR